MNTRKKYQFFQPIATRIASLIIGIAIFVTIFAYAIAPDRTTNANTMIIELSAKPIGYQQLLLKVNKPIEIEVKNGLNKLINGSNSLYNYIPINDYILENDTLHVAHYIDETIVDTQTYTLADIGIAHWEELGSRIEKKHFLLGTDRYGRDILSRLIIGTRISLSVGMIAVALSLSIGIVLGSIAGWYGGWMDNAIMWLINILWSMPTLLLVFAITLSIGKGFWEIFIAIGLTSWVSAARLIRGQVMQIKQLDYITAARTLGFSDSRIIVRHIWPNIMGPIMVLAAANFASAILVEAGLSFLGFGVQPPMPSWGLMIKEHYSFLIAGNPTPAIIPGLAILMLVLALNILGNRMRDVLDVKKG